MRKLAGLKLAAGIWWLGLVIGEYSLAAAEPAGRETAAQRHFFEVTIEAAEELGDPFFDTKVTVTFTRPDGRAAEVDAFYDGGRVYRARAYADTLGRWEWRSRANRPSLDGRTGAFVVHPSSLPGKLRVHPEDAHQFAYDDGRWFLHLGDTAYRFVVDTEPHWETYLDQAVRAGFTKVRTWFARSRQTVDALLTADRSGLDVAYWREIDRRLQHALQKYPHVMFQLIPYAEDAAELSRYAEGDRAARLIGVYAQARFSALPNVTWCISNDLIVTLPGRKPSGNARDVDFAAVDQVGRDFHARERWGTLLANHQARRTGYAFVDAPWSDLILLEDIDQVDGRLLLEYRAKRRQPVVLEEDRYELHRPPALPRYFFRRLMWASLLSGGHATYGGNRMYEAYDGTMLRGVRGYFDLVHAGTLARGADDLVHVHRFFADTGLTLVGLAPADERVGNSPRTHKCLASDDTVLVYLANPSGQTPQSDVPRVQRPSVTLELPAGSFTGRWFNPRDGSWHEQGVVAGGSATLTAPAVDPFLSSEDWVLLLRRVGAR